jgi:hypothetical protein
MAALLSKKAQEHVIRNFGLEQKGQHNMQRPMICYKQKPINLTIQNCYLIIRWGPLFCFTIPINKLKPLPCKRS